MNNKDALQATNRPRMIPDKQLLRIAIILAVLMVLIGMGHYLWFRIVTAERSINERDIKIEILTDKWDESEARLTVTTEWCQQQLQGIRPPEPNVMEVQE